MILAIAYALAFIAGGAFGYIADRLKSKAKGKTV
jgi:lipoprotein signal peptidase